MTNPATNVEIGADGLQALKNLRQALTACWLDEHARGGNAAVAQPSTFMCRLTVRAVLAAAGPGAGLLGVAGTLRLPGGRGERDHAWLDDGHHLFDLTADQFGYPGIVACASQDGQHVPDAAATRSLKRLVADTPDGTCWPGAPERLQAALVEAVSKFTAWHGWWANRQDCARLGTPPPTPSQSCLSVHGASRPRPSHP